MEDIFDSLEDLIADQGLTPEEWEDQQIILRLIAENGPFLSNKDK